MCTCSNGYSGDGLVNCKSESLEMYSLHTNTYVFCVYASYSV